MNLVTELNARAASHPERIALIQGDKQLTFAELNAAAAAGGAELKRHGLQPGDRVLLLVPPGIELYPILLAIFHAGLVAVFFDPTAKKSAIRKFLEDYPPAAFIASPKAHLLRLLFAPLRRVPQNFHTSKYVPFSRSWRPQALASSDTTPHPVESNFPALITFTSGGTGAPKAASRSHGFLLEQHHAVASALDYRDAEVDLSTLPIFTLATLASGLSSVIPSSDDPAKILQECLANNVTRCAASPGFFLKLHKADAFPPFQRIHTGGAPVFPDFLRDLENAHPTTRATIVYGSTEAEPISHIDWQALSESDHRAMHEGKGMPVGKPVDSIALRIIKQSPEPNCTTSIQGARCSLSAVASRVGGSRPLERCSRFSSTPIKPSNPNPFSPDPLPARLSIEQFDQLTLTPGSIGEIVVAGKHVLKGYLDPQRDIETKLHVGQQIWHRTGDAGWLDAQGRLWLVGRCSAIIHRPNAPAIHPFGIECAARLRCGIGTCALVEHREKVTLICEGSQDNALATRIQNEFPEIEHLHFLPTIPLDRRHNAKIDYPALGKLLK